MADVLLVVVVVDSTVAALALFSCRSVMAVGRRRSIINGIKLP